MSNLICLLTFCWSLFNSHYFTRLSYKTVCFLQKKAANYTLATKKNIKNQNSQLFKKNYPDMEKKEKKTP